VDINIGAWETVSDDVNISAKESSLLLIEEA
jgi:hypothetical protein